MKHKILLKSFLMLALIVTLGTQVYASEVVGNLSSSSTQNTQSGSGGSEVNGTIGNGTLAGNVGGGSTSSTSGGGGNSGGDNTGSVLGESQVIDNQLSDNLSTDGTSLKSSYNRGLALDANITPDTSGNILGAETAEGAPLGQPNTGFDGFRMSSGNWFWIVLFILLIVGIMIYFYSRRENKNRAY